MTVSFPFVYSAKRNQRLRWNIAGDLLSMGMGGPEGPSAAGWPLGGPSGMGPGGPECRRWGGGRPMGGGLRYMGGPGSGNMYTKEEKEERRGCWREREIGKRKSFQYQPVCNG